MLALPPCCCFLIVSLSLSLSLFTQITAPYIHTDISSCELCSDIWLARTEGAEMLCFLCSILVKSTPGFPLYQPTLPVCLPLLIKIITLLSSSTFTHCEIDISSYTTVICSKQICWYLTCLLPLTMSPWFCPCNLTCRLSFDLGSACSLSAFSLPGLSLRRLLPLQNLDCACRPGFLVGVCLGSWTLAMKFWTVPI